eukprot:GEMP01061021.1.p1 GENE.GEMP01061021.1~~GEMP01061021.1.p1  ORF type:complete len:302 (+),score=89.18 GEMP01061021.1:287-1192(+)
MCTVPVMFNYHLEPTLGAEWTRFLNDDLARTANTSDRLVGLGSLPMQDTNEAVKEMKRAAALGLRGFQIGSHINAYDSKEGVKNVMLSDEALRPIWETAKSLDVGMFIHPWDMEWCDKKYWLPWLVGMPAEVSLAICSIMLGGVLDQVPDLKIMFAHGGGAFPGTLGRVAWGYKCRPDIVAMDSKKTPHEYLADRRIYVDSITHDVKMLENLVDMVGANRVAMGSDYPFPLGEVPSVAPVTNEVLNVYPGQMIEEAAFLSAADRELLLCGTALDFLGLNRHEVGRIPAGAEIAKKRKLALG